MASRRVSVAAGGAVKALDPTVPLGFRKFGPYELLRCCESIWSVVVDVDGSDCEPIRSRRRSHDGWVELPLKKKKKKEEEKNHLAEQTAAAVVLTLPFLVFLPPIIYTTSAQIDLNNCLSRRERKKKSADGARTHLSSQRSRTWPHAFFFFFFNLVSSVEQNHLKHTLQPPSRQLHYSVHRL